MTGSAYALHQHVPELAEVEGLSKAQCDALDDWESSEHFSDSEQAVLAVADAMTLEIQVPDEIFDRLKNYFSDRQIVELAVLIGMYNMHSRVFQALDVELEDAP